MSVPQGPDARTIPAFLSLAGEKCWAGRIALLHARVAGSPRYGRLLAQRHAAEFALEKARRGLGLSADEALLATRVANLAALDAGLVASGKVRFRAALATALDGDATIIPLLHLHRTAMLHEAAGFSVRYAGFEDGAPFDLLIAREGASAEIACDTFSAEAGRFVRRAAWMRLIDRIDPDLQTWLAAHPGRYLLKMTLPNGLRDSGEDGGAAALAELHQRINAMLSASRRADYDEAAVLRLDPLMLTAAQADENGLMSGLRQEFGPEAQLAVTGGGRGVLVLAARAGSENEVATAMRRRLAAIAPARLTGTRPGILAMFIEDTDRLEWRLLREHLTLEGEARQFLTDPAARSVVAITCASRFELCREAGAESAMRFRNPAHPAARSAALAPAVLSTV
ncbi:hypothetical protein AiwAL_07995 [Acidiphilium sp. AL]|uniref:Uncharacterized protein n=1 Tax=Acidiphilium iwatense TaxID=768198 RepID=A0ABS9DYM7_9PROT|nr:MULTISPECIES: hypothetical protein [Acidiphilium]MCF3947857.1 hypothetical protein [Acidiphilium iwatense]MCU4160048.1 hypothetical protein [Acidiphilium sp. AL]